MTLLLDPDIRDWVVLPLFIIIVFAGLLRQVVAQYMQGSKQPVPVVAQRAQSLARHCHALRTAAAHSMTTPQWYVRRDHAVSLLRAEADRLESTEGEEANDPMEAMMSNPLGMMGGNMVFMVQNMVMMQGIQHFFSGFILLRVPFSLTVGFKHMFQRGVAEMPDLEPAYVSSVSWYFLVMYGLRSFFKLVIGSPVTEQREQEAQLQSFGLQNPPNPTANKQDPESLAKSLRAEADNLELHQHKSELDGAEKRLLGKLYPKKKSAASGKSDFLVGKKKKKH